MRVLLWAPTLLLAAMSAVAAAPEPGDRAASFALRDLDGQRVGFSADASTRSALLLFRANGCPYCKALLPELAELSREHGDVITVYAVNFGEQGDVSDALRALDLPFVLMPRGDRVAERYQVTRLPALFVVRDERVVYSQQHPPADHPAATPGPGQARRLSQF